MTPLYLGDREMLSDSNSQESNSESFEYVPTVGICGGPWYGGDPFIMADDQRADDNLSLVYNTEPLNEDLEITGHPLAKLHVSSTAKVAFFVARLCDVAPDGSVALVTKGLINATRRDSMEHPKPLNPGEIYEIEVLLDATSWIFQEGHKIRLSICGSDWPTIWPSPYTAMHTIHRGPSHPSRLIIPISPKQNPILPDPKLFPPPGYPKTANTETLLSEWKIIRDLYRETVEIHANTKKVIRPRKGVSVCYNERTIDCIASSIRPGDVSVKGVDIKRIETPNMVVEAKSMALTKSTESTFHLAINLDVTLNGMLHFSKKWMKSVPRNLI
jgi:hypothetical protein